MIEHVEELEVPKNSGKEGFLSTVRAILKLPLVQRIVIEPTKVTVTRFVDPNKPIVPVEIDFEGLLPYSVIRNCEKVKEVPDTHVPASLHTAVFSLFTCAQKDRLFPLAFVTGADTVLYKWVYQATGVEPEDDDPLFGVPVYRDRQIEDTQLYLCAGRSRGGALVDTVRAYKFLMPEKL